MMVDMVQCVPLCPREVPMRRFWILSAAFVAAVAFTCASALAQRGGSFNNAGGGAGQTGGGFGTTGGGLGQSSFGAGGGMGASGFGSTGGRAGGSGFGN